MRWSASTAERRSAFRGNAGGSYREVYKSGRYLDLAWGQQIARRTLGPKAGAWRRLKLTPPPLEDGPAAVARSRSHQSLFSLKPAIRLLQSGLSIPPTHQIPLLFHDFLAFPFCDMMIPIYQLPVPVSSTFHHRPLVDRRHIRLLRLHPGHYALRKDAPWLIEYEIVHVSLDAAPLFEAVSYVWGSTKKTQLIRLLPASRTLAVTDALTQVLAHLNKTSTTGYLWIDQLCVNQDDELERNHQVSMMGEIYSKARRTLVWLGEPDADSNLVLGTLDIVGDRSKDFAFRRNRKEAEAQGRRDVTRLRTHLHHAIPSTCSVHGTTKGDMMDMDGPADEQDDYCPQCFEEAATDRVKAACRVMNRPWVSVSRDICFLKHTS